MTKTDTVALIAVLTRIAIALEVSVPADIAAGEEGLQTEEDLADDALSQYVIAQLAIERDDTLEARQ